MFFFIKEPQSTTSTTYFICPTFITNGIILKIIAQPRLFFCKRSLKWFVAGCKPNKL